MKPQAYPCPLPGGAAASELALTCDRGRRHRVLIAPALFDEANRMRHFSVEVMRRLDAAGIDVFLPDLPGCNESLRDLASIEGEDWRMALEAAARHFAVSHVLAIRGGALWLPERLPGWLYAPVKGASLLKTLLRARVLAAREAGREETTAALLAQGLEHGLDLAGYPISAELLQQVQRAVPPRRAGLTVIEQETLAGGALWLRAEPDEDPAQADALAAIVAMGLMA